MKPNETAFLNNGQEVEYIQKLDCGKHLVSPTYSHEEDSYSSGHLVVDQVYPNPPLVNVDSRIRAGQERVDELGNKVRELKREILALENEVATAEKYKGVGPLRDFIDGKLTHVVVDSDGAYTVHAWPIYADGEYRRGPKGPMKLLTLFGGSKGD